MTTAAAPIPMILTCPCCGARHIDEDEFATKSHHTHACQGCGACWRPAIEPTVGVQFLPGFKNDPKGPLVERAKLELAICLSLGPKTQAVMRELIARVEACEIALAAVRDIAADRKKFILLGPRAFMAAVQIVDAVLPPKKEESDVA